MKPSFAICAQSLDNVSATHLVVDGLVCAADAIQSREECALLVTDVIRRARSSWEHRGLRIYADADDYVVEAPTEQRDVLGRTATVVMFARLPDVGAEGVGQALVQRLVEHLPMVERTVSPDVLENVARSDECLAKSNTRPSRSVTTVLAVMAAVGAAAAAIAAVVGGLL